MTTNNPALLL